MCLLCFRFRVVRLVSHTLAVVIVSSYAVILCSCRTKREMPEVKIEDRGTASYEVEKPAAEVPEKTPEPPDTIKVPDLSDVTPAERPPESAPGTTPSGVRD